MRTYRNYWLAFCCCMGVTVLSLMGSHGMENWQWYLKSDINVSIWLFVAWLFDFKE